MVSPARAPSRIGSAPASPEPSGGPHLLTIGLCPRCNYAGSGVSYFSRGGNIAALGALTLFTLWPAFGAGGFIYWAIRRDHRICPRCGLSWGKDGERMLVPVTVPPRNVSRPSAPPSPEGARRTWSILFFVVGLFFLIGGITAPDAGAAVFGLAFGGGGLVLHLAANRAREERRQAMLAALQTQVIKLAGERGGRLTVTETAGALAWPLRRAEKVLHSLDDGLRVDSEVSDEGIIVYHFRELLLGSEGGDSAWP